MLPPVTYDNRGPVAWVTIDRPEAHNALNAAVRRGLWDAFARFNTDEQASVMVLTGAGDRSFCAGADLKEMAETELTVPPPDFIPQIGRNVKVAKPVIGAINGACLGGGFLLAQGCDLLVASSTATFGIPEVRVGRGSPWALPLTTMVPRAIAMEILLTGQPITAQRAYQVGLVNEITSPDELVARAQSLGEIISSNAPLSVMAAKRTAYLLAGERMAQAFDEAEDLWRPVYLSSDAQEGPRAFKEKRRPIWRSR
ncbi:MAG: enoyl-CoA hydratase/isomerase family protein [Candidatus Limnocylindrales bacterium]